jgi:hypothetical protein
VFANQGWCCVDYLNSHQFGDILGFGDAAAHVLTPARPATKRAPIMKLAADSGGWESLLRERLPSRRSKWDIRID